MHGTLTGKNARKITAIKHLCEQIRRFRSRIHYNIILYETILLLTL